jgi:hypothetical protein
LIPEPDDRTLEDLIAIRTFTSESEADIAKGALQAFGIECMLSHDDCGGQQPPLLMGEGVRLMVRSGDAAQAEEALTAGEPAE